MSPLQRLAAIARELLPCPAPDLANGVGPCPCGSGERWPCPVTRAAFIAYGLDPDGVVEVVLESVARRRNEAAAVWPGEEAPRTIMA